MQLRNLDHLLEVVIEALLGLQRELLGFLLVQVRPKHPLLEPFQLFSVCLDEAMVPDDGGNCPEGEYGVYGQLVGDW